MPNEVFLSHSSADRAFVARLANVLRSHGIPVWYSDTDIRGAQQWHDEIGSALKRCDWLVLILSPDAVASKWVKSEGVESGRGRNPTLRNLIEFKFPTSPRMQFIVPVAVELVSM